MTFKESMDNILDAALGREDEKIRARAKRIYQQKYFYAIRKHSFQLARTRIEVDFTAMTDETGLYLPSNLFGIDAIWDEDNEVRFWPRNRFGVDYEDFGFRFYTYTPETTPVASGDDLVLAHGGTTFVSASLTTDYSDDNYVKFGGEPGFYLLSAIKTFSPTYYGPDIAAGGHWQIRPKETQKLVLVDANEKVLDDRSVYVYYWQAPEPLYMDWQEPILPDMKWVELMVLREIPEAKARRPVSEREIEKAEAEVLAMNPDFELDPRPRDKHAAMFTFSSESMYVER